MRTVRCKYHVIYSGVMRHGTLDENGGCRSGAARFFYAKIIYLRSLYNMEMMAAITSIK